MENMGIATGRSMVDGREVHTVTAGGGESWHGIVAHTVSHGLPGLENLALIPGTAGAAPIQNYEQYLKEHDFEPSGPFHQQFSYFPEEGELVLFPSWLVHKVPSHHAKEERVAWPYNYKGTTWDGWARTAL